MNPYWEMYFGGTVACYDKLSLPCAPTHSPRQWNTVNCTFKARAMRMIAEIMEISVDHVKFYEIIRAIMRRNRKEF